MALPSTKPDPQPEPEYTRGGAREDAGRPSLPKRKKLSRPAYVSLSPSEKAEVKRQAKREELTVSMYLRKALGLPVHPNSD